MSDLWPRAEPPHHLSRRSFLRRTVLLTGATALLAACTSVSPAAPPPAPTPPALPASGQVGEAVSAAETPTMTAPASTPAGQATPLVPSVPAPSVTLASTTPRPGGTLIVARTADATSLDPQLTPSLARQRITMLTYNNLVKLSNDVAIQPDLAETWKVSPDGKRIDFTLRKGVLWHPPVSREVTAGDVAYSYERLLRDSPGRTDFADVDGIEVLDKYSVRFVLSTANAGLLASMADSRWGAIVNRETVAKHGDLSTVAVGTGPFILEAWQSGQEMKLRRNPDYFEKGKPYVEHLLVRIIPAEANVVAGLKSGAIHHAILEDPRYVEQLAGQPSLQLHRAPRLGYDFLTFNQATPPFNRPEVMQAVNYAVDRDECIKSGAGGYAVQTAPCTPPMKQWLLPDQEWKPFYRLDLDRAKALLAAAGYPNGFEMTVLRIRDSDADAPAFVRMQATAEVVQGNLKRIGINVRLENIPFEQWLRRWQKKELEATMNTSPGFADPDAAFYRAFHSRAQNWNNIVNPELDRLLDEGRAVVEIEKRKPIYDKVQLQLLQKPGHLFLFTPEMVDVTQKRVHGFSQHPTTTLWSYPNVWLDG